MVPLTAVMSSAVINPDNAPTCCAWALACDMVVLVATAVLIAPVVKRGGWFTAAMLLVLCCPVVVEQSPRVTNAVFPDRTVLPTYASVPKAAPPNTRVSDCATAAGCTTVQKTSASRVRKVAKAIFIGDSLTNYFPSFAPNPSVAYRIRFDKPYWTTDAGMEPPTWQ